MARILIALLLAFFLIWPSMFAQMSHNTDTKTIGAVTEMTAAQMGVETIHNTAVDSVNRKTKAIAKYTATIASIKELYRISMQNIDGFGQETAIYQEIAMHTIDIMRKLPIALNELRKRPTSTIMTYNKLADISLHATSAVNTFIKVVNNGRVSIKAKDLKEWGSNDGLNLLNRSDRYILANNVLTDLQEINWKIDAIIYVARFCNSFSDYLLAIDSRTWYSLYTGVNYANMISQLYKQL